MSDHDRVPIRACRREVNNRHPSKRYEGKRSYGQVFVTVNGRALDPRFDLRTHSPDGFEWGYGGSGPAQLALALLADCLNDDGGALALYQDFKRAVVASLPRDAWTLTEEEVRRAVRKLRAPGKHEGL
jgi:hypothetical protein